MALRDTRRLELLLSASLLVASLSGCSSKSPCEDPLGSGCGRTDAYATDDPRSVCHICCESSTSRSDAWTEVSQTDVASGHFRALAAQGHPYRGSAQFNGVEAVWNGQYFSFDGRTVDLQYHLFTRGRSDEGNLHLYFLYPGDGWVSAGPLNCAIARN